MALTRTGRTGKLPAGRLDSEDLASVANEVSVPEQRPETDDFHVSVALTLLLSFERGGLFISRVFLFVKTRGIFLAGAHPLPAFPGD